MLLQATVKIKGTKPLLFHCFTVDTIPLEKREKTGVAGNDPDEWKRTYSATETGQLYLDPSYIFACLREGAKYTKRGVQSKVASCLQVLNNEILFDRYVPFTVTEDKTQPVYIDVRSVRNPNTKGRNIRYRLALSPGWESEFTIVWDGTIVSRQQMNQVCIDSGKLVGLADGRSIGLGRFEIVEFELIGEENAKKSIA